MLAKASNKLLSKAKRLNLQNISTILSTGTLLPFNESSLDHVLLIDVLQEIREKEKLFQEVKRVLKDRGLITVYPMHLDNNEVSRIATKAILEVKEMKFLEQVLVFEKRENK